MTRPAPLRASLLAGVPHGFLTRVGGVSSGPFASLNCGTATADRPEDVAENRRRAAHAVAPGATLLGLQQVHDSDCVTAYAPWDGAARPRANALVTATPGLALAILTADCAPVLFHDARAGVIGAAHAGWRGAVAGVTDTVLSAMEGLGGTRSGIAAAIGPCIAQGSYQVDGPLRDAVLGESPDAAGCFVADGAGRWRFDLPGYVAHRLRAAGVARVERLDADTCADPARFFSHRRTTLTGAPGDGRQISIIALP